MIEGPNYIFVENPKTGTSAVRDYLLAHCEGTESVKYPQRHQHLTAPEDKFVFCGWRDPMDRLASAWRHMYPSYRELTFDTWLDTIRNRFGYDIQTTPQIVYAQYVNDFLWYGEGLRRELNRILKRLGYDPMRFPQLEVKNAGKKVPVSDEEWQRAFKVADDRGLLVDICKRYC